MLPNIVPHALPALDADRLAVYGPSTAIHCRRLARPSPAIRGASLFATVSPAQVDPPARLRGLVDHPGVTQLSDLLRGVAGVAQDHVGER